MYMKIRRYIYRLDDWIKISIKFSGALSNCMKRIDSGIYGYWSRILNLFYMNLAMSLCFYRLLIFLIQILQMVVAIMVICHLPLLIMKEIINV